MQEATGQASLMNIMLTIIGILIILLTGSIAYSKAFRVKEKIIDIVEKYNGYDKDSKKEIEDMLTNLGYRTLNAIQYKNFCNSKKFDNFDLDSSAIPDHMYCVYKRDLGNNSYYYKIVAYMYFDIPVVGNYIQIPISGETKILYSDSAEDWKTVY